MEDFADWVEATRQAGISVEMLREHIERLLEAVNIMYVLFVCSFVPYTVVFCFVSIAYSTMDFDSAFRILRVT